MTTAEEKLELIRKELLHAKRNSHRLNDPWGTPAVRSEDIRNILDLPTAKPVQTPIGDMVKTLKDNDIHPSDCLSRLPLKIANPDQPEPPALDCNCWLAQM